jgi:hypothetical protein
MSVRLVCTESFNESGSFFEDSCLKCVELKSQHVCVKLDFYDTLSQNNIPRILPQHEHVAVRRVSFNESRSGRGFGEQM